MIAFNGVRAEQIRKALDTLGLALANHGHKWTKRERWLYGRANGFVQKMDKPAPANSPSR